jgi:hypothetical protein
MPYCDSGLDAVDEGGGAVKRSMFVMTLAALGAGAVLADCSGMNGSSGTPQTNASNNPGAQQPGFAQFTDIPIPPKNSIDLDRTVVFGQDRDWIGRISLSSSMSMSDVYDFYKREMPRLGWTELTSVRSATSVLTFQMDNRIATIQLGGGNFGLGTQIDFWMNPREQGGGGGAASFSPGGGLRGGGSVGPVDSAPLPPSHR